VRHIECRIAVADFHSGGLEPFVVSVFSLCRFAVPDSALPHFDITLFGANDRLDQPWMRKQNIFTRIDFFALSTASTNGFAV